MWYVKIWLFRQCQWFSGWQEKKSHLDKSENQFETLANLNDLLINISNKYLTCCIWWCSVYIERTHFVRKRKTRMRNTNKCEGLWTCWNEQSKIIPTWTLIIQLFLLSVFLHVTHYLWNKIPFAYFISSRPENTVSLKWLFLCFVYCVPLTVNQERRGD